MTIASWRGLGAVVSLGLGSALCGGGHDESAQINQQALASAARETGGAEGWGHAAEGATPYSIALKTVLHGFYNRVKGTHLMGVAVHGDRLYVSSEDGVFSAELK